MSDARKFFKVNCSSLSDLCLSDLDICDFGRWVKFGVYMKAHGNRGQITLSQPARSLCLAMQVDSFSHLISTIKRIPGCRATDIDLGRVSVIWSGWAKDQEDRRTPVSPTKYLDVFEEVWSGYPNNDGKKGALMSFASSVKTDKDCGDIRLALSNYLAHLKSETWKRPKNGSTWFNNWQDWTNRIVATQTRQEKDF